VSVAAFGTFAGAVIRLRHPATEANASSRLATFQQLVTTPTVKEHAGQQLAGQPDLRALDIAIGEAESATERRLAQLSGSMAWSLSVSGHADGLAAGDLARVLLARRMRVGGGPGVTPA
jgi:hypothetical protein